MLEEIKIGEVVVLAQITFYVYANQEKRDKDEYFLCTSDKECVYNTIKQMNNLNCEKLNDLKPQLL
jgi:hypothetical protein